MNSVMTSQYLTILSDLDDGVYFLDRQRLIIYWNPAAERITGYTASEVIGRSCKDNLLIHVTEDGLNLCTSHCPVSATLLDGISRNAQVYLHHKNGHRVPVHVRTFPLRGEDGSIMGVAEVFTDNSFQRIESNKIQELIKYSFVDETTGFFNQRYAKSKINSMLTEMRINEVPFAVLSVTINNYRQIEQAYGQKAAEKLMAVTAGTTNSVIDVDKVVCRWKEEQLVVLILNMKSILVRRYADKLSILLQESFVSFHDEKIYPQANINFYMVDIAEQLDNVTDQIRLLMNFNNLK